MLRLRTLVLFLSIFIFSAFAQSAEYDWIGEEQPYTDQTYWWDYGDCQWDFGEGWRDVVTGNPPPNDTFPVDGDTTNISRGRLILMGNEIAGYDYPVNLTVNVSGSGWLDLAYLEGWSQAMFFGVGHPMLQYSNTSATFNQSGGTVSSHISADAYMSFLCFGAGETGLGTYNQTGGVLQSSSGMTFGALGGTGIYNQSGGKLEMNNGYGAMVLGYGEPYMLDGVLNPYYPGYGEQYIDIEITGAGHGEWNISGNATAEIEGNMIIGKSGGSTGVLNMNGGKITLKYNPENTGWETPLMLVGYDGHGTINLNAGTLHIDNTNGSDQCGDLYLGYADNMAASGTVKQTGGRLIANNVVMGQGNDAGVTANYSISGGEMMLDGSIFVGTHTANTAASSAGMDISGRAKVQVGGNILFGSVYYDPAVEFFKEPTPARPGFIDGVLNISGGEISVGGQVGAEAANVGTVNILGSKATIHVGDYNIGVGDLTTNWTLDRNGLSTLNVARTAVLSSYTLDMPAGFHSLGTDSIDVVIAGMLTGTHTLDNQTPYDFDVYQDGTTLRYDIASSDYQWDLRDEITFSEQGVTAGTLRVEGENNYLLARFVNLDPSMSSAMVDFLNSGVLDNGAKFFVDANNNILLDTNYLGPDGYAYFAWDLSGFGNGAVTLQGFNEVPEPATWLLLLCGVMGVVYMRKRR